MKRKLLKAVFVLSKTLLPSYYDKDLLKLSSFDKAVIALRYWLTVRILD